MALTKEDKAKLIQTHQKGEKDTGSSEIQVAMLSEQIRRVTGHLKSHKHDVHSQRGLLQMVGQRKRHLRYLRKSNPAGYTQLIAKLGIRG